MKRILALLLLAAGCKHTDGTVRDGRFEVLGRKYDLVVVHGRKAMEAQSEDGRAYLVVYGHAKVHHYLTDEKFDVLFVDDSGTVLEVGKLGGDLTSGVETSRALFLPPGSGVTVGMTIDLPEVAGREEAVLDLGGHRVYAEISQTSDERQRGFMYRRKLSKDDGMIFVYDYADTRRFWMGHCYIDLDIAFFRDDGTLINVVETRKYEDPESDPPERSTSAEPARYVLETNFGWFREHGLIDATGKPLREVTLQWRK